MSVLVRAFVIAAGVTVGTGSADRPGESARLTANPPDGDALLQHLDDLYRSKSGIARIQIDVTSARSSRSIRVRAWTRGEEEVLVLIEAPRRDNPPNRDRLRMARRWWTKRALLCGTSMVPPLLSDPRCHGRGARGRGGVPTRPYVILGACNPPLAFAAISADARVGLLLPCNVTVESTGESRTLVRLTDPEALLGSTALDGASELATVARDARDRMSRVAQTLARKNDRSMGTH